MHVERLERIAELLRTVAQTPVNERPQEFDLEKWYCLTSACAIGLAALNPWFQKQGLCLQREDKEGPYIPVFGRFEGFEAVEKFFEISNLQSRLLFFPDEYSPCDWGNPLAVARRVESLLLEAPDRNCVSAAA